MFRLVLYLAVVTFATADTLYFKPSSSDVLCPDKQGTCPKTSTCCILSNGRYGCCPLQEAACCPDHIHCCPHGSTCDDKHKRCTSAAGVSTPWLEKRPAQRVQSDVICPGGASKCPAGNTCCKNSKGTFGCCPFAQATCCGDGNHCCPSGYKCDTSHGTCLKAGAEKMLLGKMQEASQVKAVPVTGKKPTPLQTPKTSAKKRDVALEQKRQAALKASLLKAKDHIQASKARAAVNSNVRSPTPQHVQNKVKQAILKNKQPVSKIVETAKAEANRSPVGKEKMKPQSDRKPQQTVSTPKTAPKSSNLPKVKKQIEKVNPQPGKKEKKKEGKKMMEHITDTIHATVSAIKNTVHRVVSGSEVKSDVKKSSSDKEKPSKATSDTKKPAAKPVLQSKPADKKQTQPKPATKSEPAKANMHQNSAQQKATQLKAAQQKASQQKAAQLKTVQLKAAQQKAVQQKAAQLKTVQLKAAQQKAAQLKTVQLKAAQQKAVQQKAAQLKAAQLKAAQQKAVQQKAAQLKAAQQKAAQLKAAQLKAAQLKAAQQKAALLKATQQKVPQQNTAQQKPAPPKAQPKSAPQKSATLKPTPKTTNPNSSQDAKKIAAHTAKVAQRKVQALKPSKDFAQKQQAKPVTPFKKSPQPKIVPKVQQSKQKQQKLQTSSQKHQQTKTQAGKQQQLGEKPHMGVGRKLLGLAWRFLGVNTHEENAVEEDFFNTVEVRSVEDLEGDDAGDILISKGEGVEIIEDSIDLLPRKDIECPDKSTCPSDTTCCKIPSGAYGCCPVQNAVCCSDHIHCCPHGQTCDVKGGYCKAASGALSMLRKKIKSTPPLLLQKNQYGSVTCDSKFTCPDGSTCCSVASGVWACCPLPEAVCCPDKEHCCPNGYTCQNEQCVKGSIFMTWLSKTPALIRKTPAEVSKRVLCPDKTSTCDQGQTCCTMPSGKSGCCPIPKAVCCDDHIHCCPEGSTCNVKAQTCEHAMEAVPWSVKQPALHRNERVGNIICPNGENVCPDESTCCKLLNGQWGCCPMPNAVCCKDQLHCCPEGTQCNTKESRCESLTSSLHVSSTLVIPRAKVTLNQKPLEVIKCEDGTECPDGSTCCANSASKYACCPHPKGVCCADKVNCCPNGYTCDAQSKEKCKKGDISPNSLFFAFFPNKPSSPLEKASKDVNCPDKETSCPDGNTCCAMTEGGFGCCALSDAVCCAGGFCCPKGHTCDASGKKCLVSEPMRSKLPARLVQPHEETLPLVCPNVHYSCTADNTCCHLKDDTWGCCASKDAVCCDNGPYCCPKGSTCSAKPGECLPNDSSSESDKHDAAFLKRAVKGGHILY